MMDIELLQGRPFSRNRQSSSDGGARARLAVHLRPIRLNCNRQRWENAAVIRNLRGLCCIPQHFEDLPTVLSVNFAYDPRAESCGSRGERAPEIMQDVIRLDARHGKVIETGDQTELRHQSIGCWRAR